MGALSKALFLLAVVVCGVSGNFGWTRSKNLRDGAESQSSLGLRGSGFGISASGAESNDKRSKAYGVSGVESNTGSGVDAAGGTISAAKRRNGSGGYAFGEYGGSGLHGVAASNYVEADDKGYGKASNTAEGSTSGELYLQSGSKAVGGTDCSIIVRCIKCEEDSSAPRGVICKACEPPFNPQRNGNACRRGRSGRRMYA